MNGSGLVKLAVKIKRLKIHLKTWNREVFERVETNIQILGDNIVELEAKLCCAYDRDVEFELIEKRAALESCLLQEEILLKQKTRVKWLKEGDSNSKFFHATLQNRKSRGTLRNMVF